MVTPYPKTDNGGLQLTKLKQIKNQGFVQCVARLQNENLRTCRLQYHVKKFWKLKNLVDIAKSVKG